jgi:hypothetical protein
VAKTINKKNLIIWQIGGFFFLIGVGSLLHFTYAWSEFSPIVGMLSAVNESVWEHLKLGFWSLVFFSLIDYWFIGKGVKRYFLAKALGILTLQIFIVAFFYVYTIFTGEEILIIDIISFVIGCALCQVVFYRIFNDDKAPAWGDRFGIGVFIVHAVLLITFSFWTPKTEIFADPHSGEYGTSWHVDPDDHEGHDH